MATDAGWEGGAALPEDEEDAAPWSPLLCAQPCPRRPLGCGEGGSWACPPPEETYTSLTITMASGTPGARMTSSVSINISTPSFYNPQKKFAPVVAPKPKLNPFKAGGGEGLDLPSPPAAISTPPAVSGSARALIGRVGEIPAPPEDLPLPPPPPLGDDDGVGSPTSAFPPPPPPPAFEEPFPPAPEEVFPSPPPPAADAGAPATVTISIQDPQPRTQLNSIERDIDSFSSMLADMEAKDPFRSRVALDTSASLEAKSTPPKVPPPVTNFPSKFSPKPVTFPPQAPLVEPTPSLPPQPAPSAPWAARPQHKYAPVHVPAASKSPVPPPPPAPAPPAAPPLPPPVLPAPAPAPLPPPVAPHSGPPAFQTPPKFATGPTQVGAKFSSSSGTGPAKSAVAPPASGPGNPVRPLPTSAALSSPAAPSPPRGSSQVSTAPGPPARPAPSAQSPGFSYIQQKERPMVQEKPRPPGVAPAPALNASTPRRMAEPPHARPMVGSAGNPLNMKEVEELENLTQQLMREMDNPPPMEAHTTEFCGLCRKPLSRTQPAVRALEQLFHVECFTCFKCEKQLQGQQFYDVDTKPFCEGCYAGTLEKCSICKKTITDRMLRATGNAYHPQCFTCVICGKSLEGAPFIVDQGNQPHCVEDYHRKYAPRCSVCSEPIMPEAGKEETVRVVALEKNFHMKCYKCEDCGKLLSIEADESGCYPLDGHVLCIKCHTSRVKASR